MSQEAVEKVLGRLLTDEQFRTQAQHQLGAACRQEGYLLSPEEMKMLSRTDLTGFSDLAEQLNPCLRRAC